VSHLAELLDHAPCDVLFNVADEVDVAKPRRRLLAEDAFDGVDQLADETIVEIAKR
jgi:hypothetical protein